MTDSDDRDERPKGAIPLEVMGKRAVIIQFLIERQKNQITAWKPKANKSLERNESKGEESDATTRKKSTSRRIT